MLYELKHKDAKKSCGYTFNDSPVPSVKDSSVMVYRVIRTGYKPCLFENASLEAMRWVYSSKLRMGYTLV